MGNHYDLNFMEEQGFDLFDVMQQINPERTATIPMLLSLPDDAEIVVCREWTTILCQIVPTVPDLRYYRFEYVDPDSEFKRVGLRFGKDKIRAANMAALRAMDNYDASGHRRTGEREYQRKFNFNVFSRDMNDNKTYTSFDKYDEARKFAVDECIKNNTVQEIIVSIVYPETTVIAHEALVL